MTEPTIVPEDQLPPIARKGWYGGDEVIANFAGNCPNAADLASPPTLTDRDPAADLALCHAAAPLPWAVAHYPWLDAPQWWVTFGEACAAGYFERDSASLDEATARFIAMSREALPYWIERARAAEVEITRLKERS